MSLLENLKISDAVKEIQSQEIFADKRIMTVSMLGNDMYKWPAPWVFFWGGNVSVSRKNILEIGCFDESYQTWGGEDTDLGIKL